MLHRGGAGRAERAVSDGDIRRVGTMGWIIAVLAVTVATATVAVMATVRRRDAKMVMCIALAQRKYMQEHGLELTDAELQARAMAEVEEMLKKGELP